MDILYSLGPNSQWDNNELRYSLRSIAKFGINVENVYVVGYNPGFLSDKVTFIPCEGRWEGEGKQKNIIEAVVYAVKNSNIGDEFLYSSDDHFYVRKTDFDNYPYFCKGELLNKVKVGDKSRKYKISLLDTRKLLNKYNLSTFNFSWHGNTHMSRKGIELAKQLIDESYNTRYGCEPTCMILNALYSNKDTKFEITSRKDLKIHKSLTKKELIDKIKERECFSIGDNGIQGGVTEYLQELFSEKCIYEK